MNALNDYIIKNFTTDNYDVLRDKNSNVTIIESYSSFYFALKKLDQYPEILDKIVDRCFDLCRRAETSINCPCFYMFDITEDTILKNYNSQNFLFAAKMFDDFGLKKSDEKYHKLSKKIVDWVVHNMIFDDVLVNWVIFGKDDISQKMSKYHKVVSIKTIQSADILLKYGYKTVVDSFIDFIEKNMKNDKMYFDIYELKDKQKTESLNFISSNMVLIDGLLNIFDSTKNNIYLKWSINLLETIKSKIRGPNMSIQFNLICHKTKKIEYIKNRNIQYSDNIFYNLNSLHYMINFDSDQIPIKNFVPQLKTKRTVKKQSNDSKNYDYINKEIIKRHSKLVPKSERINKTVPVTNPDTQNVGSTGSAGSAGVLNKNINLNDYKNKKIICLIATHGRNKILKLNLDILQHQKNVKPIILVGVSSADDQKFIENYNSSIKDNKHHVLFYKSANNPLGKKWQNGVDICKKLNPECLMINGSDDLLSLNYVSNTYSLIKKGYDLVGVKDWNIYEANTKTVYLAQYSSAVAYSLGAGRVYSRNILGKMGWSIFDVKRNSGLDKKGYFNAQSRGANIKTIINSNISVLSYKGSWSMKNNFKTIKARTQTIKLRKIPDANTFFKKHFSNLFRTV